MSPVLHVRLADLDNCVLLFIQQYELQGSATSVSSSYRQLTLQDFDGSTSQLFKFVRVPNSDGVFKIHSSEHPSLVISLKTLAEGVCDSNPDLILLNDNSLDYSLEYQKWKIGSGGAVESVMCKGMVIDFQQASNGGNMSIYLNEKNDNWSQKWTVKSDNVVLLEAGGNSTQTWSPIFVDPGYDLALHPGFPGVVETVGGDTCLTSAMDRDLAKTATSSCDKSMAFLAGSELSLGTLTAIADLVEEKGPEYMPGYCCMDVATDSGTMLNANY